jgi:hypothetical protein
VSSEFEFFGGIDFSGAKEPLTNLWSAVGVEDAGKLRILSVRPHAFRADLATYVRGGWREAVGAGAGRILWGADFPFGLPEPVSTAIGAGTKWTEVLSWVADRPADEVRSAAGDAARSLRGADYGGALSPLDLRLYKQTVEGLRWLHELTEEGEVSIHPQAPVEKAATTLIEVYPSSTVQELGMPRRRTPSRPGEVRARAAALRTFMTFSSGDAEALVVNLEDAWDAAIACLTAFLCRDDLNQPFRTGRLGRPIVELEGWIYRPPATVA